MELLECTQEKQVVEQLLDAICKQVELKARAELLAGQRGEERDKMQEEVKAMQEEVKAMQDVLHRDNGVVAHLQDQLKIANKQADIASAAVEDSKTSLLGVEAIRKHRDELVIERDQLHLEKKQLMEWAEICTKEIALGVKIRRRMKGLLKQWHAKEPLTPHDSSIDVIVKAKKKSFKSREDVPHAG